MVDVLNTNSGNALAGTQLNQNKQEEEEAKVLKVYQSSIPPVQAEEEAEVAWDDGDLFSDVDTYTSQEEQDNLEIFNDLDTYKSTEEQDYDQMFSDEEIVVTAEDLFELPEEQEGDRYVPQSWESFVKEEQAKGVEIDVLGFTEHSIPVSLYEWTRSAIDDDYIPENSIKGRLLAIEDIDQRLKKLQEINASHKSMDILWKQKHKLRYQNMLDEAMVNSEFNLEETWDMIKEKPWDFAKGTLQEVINKPSLIVVPYMLAARTAVAVGKSAQVLNSMGVSTRVAQTTAGLGAAYTGGLTIGVIDRAIEYNAKGHDVEAMKIVEQSHMDGVLGITLAGTGKVLHSGFKRVKARSSIDPKDVPEDPNAIDVESINEALDEDTPDFVAVNPKNQEAEKNFQALRKAKEFTYDTIKGGDTITTAKLGDPIHLDIEPAAPYLDEFGNVHVMEFEEAVPVGSYQMTIDQAMDVVETSTVKRDAKLQELKDLNDQYSNSFDDETISPQDMNGIRDKIDQVELELVELEESVNVATAVNKWHEPDSFKPEKYTEVETLTGPYTFKMLEKEDLESGIASVTGISGMEFDMVSGNVKPKGFAEKTIRTYLGSSLSYIRSISHGSPKLQQLSAMLEVDTRNPTLPIYSIDENMKAKQGQYATTLQRTLSKNMPKGRKAKKQFEADVRLHMRGKVESQDPRVLEVSAVIRSLLDESFEYLNESGVKTGKIENRLPRNYVREPFQDEAKAGEFMNVVMEAEGVDIVRAEQIREGIAEDLQEIGGVKFAMDGKETGVPRGDRSLRKVKDADLDDFLTEEFFASIYQDLFSTVRKAEMAKVFGVDGVGLRKLYQEASEEYKANTGQVLDEKLRSDVEDAYNLLNGTYSKPQTGTGKTVTDSLIAFETITNLDMVTYSSLLEPVSNLFALREGNTLTGVGALLRTFYSALGGNKIQRAILGPTELDMRIREAEELLLLAGTETQNTMSRLTSEGLSGWPKKLTSGFIRSVGLHAFTEINRAVAYATQFKDLSRTIQMLAEKPNHKLTETRRRWLMEATIDPEHAIKWYKNGSDVNDPFYEALKRGANRRANSTIANPTILNKTKLTASSHPAARLMTLFKSFAQAYNKDVFRPNVREVTTLWNEGHKLKAMEKFTALTTMMVGMGTWMATKGDIASEALGGEPSDLSDSELANRVILGTASLVIPGAAMGFSPITSPTPLSGIGGPLASDVELAAKSVPALVAQKIPFAKRIPEVKEGIKETVADALE